MGVVIVSMPSQAYTSFLPFAIWFRMWLPCRSVNALSGLYLISTSYNMARNQKSPAVCQCPLGLIPHFYESGVNIDPEEDGKSVNALSGLYLISTWMTSLISSLMIRSVNALSGLYLISTEDLLSRLISQLLVSMPSRAYTSFLRYHFKNLGFMRFPEPVFAGICQNILTTAVFRAC